jgi:hypothetical protein
MPARHAEASIKACRAVELVGQGKTYDQVARAVGFANRGTAHRVVTRALAGRLVDGIDDLRHIELGRLDALQAALWPRVEKGEVRAINSVVRIIDRRCRSSGSTLNRPEARGPSTLWSYRTLATQGRQPTRTGMSSSTMSM